MFAGHLCDLRLDLTLTVASPLHVGAGDAGSDLRTPRLRGSTGDHPPKARTRPGYTLHLEHAKPASKETALPLHRLDDAGAPTFYVPSTSLRGAFRHLLRVRIDHAAQAGWRPDLALEPASGEAHEDGDPADPAYWALRFGNPAVRQLFGTTARRGAVAFGDAVVDAKGPLTARYSDLKPDVRGGSFPGPSLRMLTSNALDRFTMASTVGLRTLTALEVGTTLHTTLTLRAFSWWQVGAIAVALKAFNDGHAALGTRRAVGLGRVHAKITGMTVRYHALAGVDPTTRALPGFDAVLARTDYPAATRDRAGGLVGAHRLRLRDADDVLPLPDGARLEPNAHRSDLLMSTFAVISPDLDALVTQASRRLAAVVGQEVSHG